MQLQSLLSNKTTMMISLLCALLIFATGVSGQQGVEKLTDANFEHDTQATTGSTTGNWLVLFHDANNKQQAMDVLTRPVSAGEEEATSTTTLADQLMEAGVVVGAMDVTANPETVDRLEIPGAPYAVLLSKGKMYHTNSWENLREFATSGYANEPAKSIPPPSTFWDNLLKQYANKPKGELASMMLVGIMGVILLSVIVARRNVSGYSIPANEAAGKMSLKKSD